MKKIVEQVIQEYLSREMVSLKDYFSQSEESKKSYLPHTYYELFDEYLEQYDIDFEKPDGYEDYELMDFLKTENPDLYKEFAEYLYDEITNRRLPINDTEYPAWSFFDDSPEIIKNQWLIHFTDEAKSIAEEGFLYGVDEADKLGLTTQLSEFDKKYGGYNFAYTLTDFVRYAGGGWRNKGYKYGDEAVIFNASGIKLLHYGDEEPQVIFYGNTAKNIIPITYGKDTDWGVYSVKTDKLLYENDELEKVVEWVVKNYNQYRKELVRQ